MGNETARNLERVESRRDSKLKAIDLKNLKYADVYRYEVVDGLHEQVVLKGEAEGPNASQVRDWIKFEYQDRLEAIGDYRIHLYEWIPETLHEDGMWELVDNSLISEQHGLLDLQRIEGKTIQSVDRVYDNGEVFLRIRFTDGMHFDVGDIRYKDWYVSPF